MLAGWRSHRSSSGRFVHLTPMSLADVAGLLAAATQDRSRYGYTRVPDDG